MQEGQHARTHTACVCLGIITAPPLPSLQVDLHVGTLSKAFGALGGFVACSRPMKQLLLNRGRAYIYSTSLPVPVVEAAAAAMRVSAR